LIKNDLKAGNPQNKEIANALDVEEHGFHACAAMVEEYGNTTVVSKQSIFVRELYLMPISCSIGRWSIITFEYTGLLEC